MSLNTAKKRVLVCPLNWGLGHATRCIPVINELLAQNAEVVIGADKWPYDMLKLEFPSLEFIRFTGFEISYSKRIPLAIKMVTSLPGLLKSIREEHLMLHNIIKQYKIDAVISDNRYGLWSENVPTVFITHQVFPHVPAFEAQVYKMIRGYMDSYTHCWIPDYKSEPNLSGSLSHKKPLPDNTEFIGPLSRFNQYNNSKNNSEIKYDLFVIISGPEPQRTIFQNKVFEQLKSASLKGLIVTGEPDKKESYHLTETIKVISHLETQDFYDAFCASEIILSRSGYSTIMDIASIEKKVILIPTPGQTEQVYLAKYLSGKNMAVTQCQTEMNINAALKSINEIKPLYLSQDNTLKEKVKSLLEIL